MGNAGDAKRPPDSVLARQHLGWVQRPCLVVEPAAELPVALDLRSLFAESVGIAAQQQRVRARLYRLAANLRKAREIRDLVALVEQRVAGNGEEALLPVFGRWKEEALAEAERLDPALMPLEALLASK